MQCAIGCGRVNLGKHPSGICLPCKAAARKRYLTHRENVNRFIASCERAYLETQRTKMIYG
jgi:hypothetical protein